MALSDLPIELIDTIFEPLSASTLAVLSRTSQLFKPCASRLLYRHLALSSVTRNLSAVNTLASRPHLSPLVRKFSLTIEDDAADLDQKYYVRLSQALRSLQDVTSLELHIDANLSWVLPKSSSYPHLRHFSCSFGLDKDVTMFLTRTPALRSLQLAAESPNCCPLPRSAVPNLISYTGPPNLLPQLLPARPLNSLHLSGDLTIEDIEHFTDAPTPTATHPHCRDRWSTPTTSGADAIETLSTITSAHPVSVIEALAGACPNLVSLQLIASYAFWQAPDITFCTRVSAALSHLRHLNAFELSGIHWQFRNREILTTDGTCVEKEWMSPPVTPRLDAMEGLGGGDWEFDEAFMEWAY
ncbi:hypothetical protein BDY19DRAFT_1024845 [Irpex rosettiformis]|uniref:Uncharacterized protein n=1 Tax=Irpex rosettiformis TaxID=378272 RepID=A0ACB8UEN7_9APHY|nr:hypothetical protein BDY19DRAFT_1024845 [Irpex rosettiformis]